MIVSRTVTLDVNALVEIQDLLDAGEFTNLSDFVQNAVHNELIRHKKD